MRELLGEKWKSSAFIAKAAAISNREDLGALDSGGSAFLIGAATETAQQSPRYVYGGGAAGRKNFGQLDSLLDSAIQDLEQPAAKAAPTAPVYTYLLQAQFSAYENKSDALAYGCMAPNPPPEKRVPTTAELQAAQSKMNKFIVGSEAVLPKPPPTPLSNSGLRSSALTYPIAVFARCNRVERIWRPIKGSGLAFIPR